MVELLVMSKKKYRLVTLGCRTNQYETEAFRAQLEGLGYGAVAVGEGADVCLVNTCTVTENADRDSRRQIRKLMRENPGAQVVVTGCAVETGAPWIEEIGGEVQVVGNREKEQALARLFPDAEALPEFKIEKFEAHTRAFVKVQDGCNSFCTYCIIPYVRGRSRCRPLDEVVREVEGLVGNGYKEIVLTGINIGDYEGGLAPLVRAVDRVEGLERIRISSIDPDEVDDELLEAVVGGEKTCHSMHIVLQAGSNVTLKRMNRKYTRQEFYRTVERLRAADPDFTFTTDVIVGFPGESERDFAETLEVMDEVDFAKVHMFPYSDRPRTRASLYPEKVAAEVIAERKSELLRRAERGAHALRERFVGRRMKVLLESAEGGHTDNFLEVRVGGGRPNELVEVELMENTPNGLVGRCESLSLSV
jgi:threonylcarbamoyladenosine tRNA methylthiotransferase MtaB